MKLYLAVTPDEYELPIAVADSAPELARMIHTGISAQGIHNSINKHSSGVHTGIKFLRIEVMPDEVHTT